MVKKKTAPLILEDDSKNKNHQIIIPNYIAEYSLQYNNHILPIYLFLKQRSNRENEIYFSYKALLQYYEQDKFSKAYEQDILTTLVFLISGVHQANITINQSFSLSSKNKIIKNLFSILNISIDEEHNTMTIECIDKQYEINEIIKLLLEQLNQDNNILLIDRTALEVKGYLLIPLHSIKLLEWYCTESEITIKKLETGYSIKDSTLLLEYKEKFRLISFSKETKLSFTQLVNMYIFIYKLYIANQNLNKTTHISQETFVKKLSSSKTTISTYLYILQYLGLLQVKKGSFKNKVSNSYSITEKWKIPSNKDLYDFTVYKYTILSQEQFQQIRSCYKKNQPTDTPVKRGRGRPRKNPL